MKAFTAIALVLALAACASPTTSSGTATAPPPTPAQIAAAGQQAMQAAGAGISVAQSAACSAQSLLNLIGSMEGGGAAQQASTASADAGKLCVWTNPVSASWLWVRWHNHHV